MGVGQADLEFPFLGPVFLLLILTALDQQHVLSGLQRGGEAILVDLHASMVFIAAEEEFSVEPDLPAVLASQSDFRGARLVGPELGGGIACDFLEVREGLIEINDSIVAFGLVVLPADLAQLAVVFGG